MGCETMLDVLDSRLEGLIRKINHNYEDEAFIERDLYQGEVNKVGYAIRFIRDNRDELIKECEEASNR
jgi:hypothetical protein